MVYDGYGGAEYCRAFNCIIMLNSFIIVLQFKKKKCLIIAIDDIWINININLALLKFSTT